MSTSSPVGKKRKREQSSPVNSLKNKRQRVTVDSMVKDAAVLLEECLPNVKGIFKNPEGLKWLRHIKKICQEILDDIHQPSRESLTALMAPLRKDLLVDSGLVTQDAAECLKENLYSLRGPYELWLGDKMEQPLTHKDVNSPIWQGGTNAGFNVCRNKQQDLPLSILDPLFARFHHIIQEPPSDPVYLPLAERVASQLCCTMTQKFETQTDRANTFEKHFKLLFEKPDSILFYSQIHKDEQRKFFGDLIVSIDPSVVNDGNDEKQIGDGDDLIQIHSIYRLYINNLKVENPAKLQGGVPMIFLGILGPLLIVSGAFFDGSSTVVQAIGPPCLMVKDYHHLRQKTLANVLLAVKEALERPSQPDNPSNIPKYAPCTPRVYPYFTTFEGEDITLTFQRRLCTPVNGLLFIATASEKTTTIIVKLIAGNNYGYAVHQILASAGYAPLLYGATSTSGEFTGYAMEYLSPDDQWVTLREWATEFYEYLPLIYVELESLLGLLERVGMVHGNLQPDNILIREKRLQSMSTTHLESADKKIEKFEIKVVDFDWAGVSGEVRYPSGSSKDLPWPGYAGLPILTEYDRKCINEFFDEPIIKK